MNSRQESRVSAVCNHESCIMLDNLTALYQQYAEISIIACVPGRVTVPSTHWVG